MGAYKDLFPLPNSPLLILSLLLGIYSIVLSYRGNYKLALGMLISSGFVLRLFMAHIDPYLHEWDERFHALVARNMMDQPFKPMLIPAGWLDYNFHEWSWNHIWLHKQPLFLWQMAVSLKIFGITPYAVRYPAVIMQTISIWMLYRVTFIATANRQIAFVAALLNCFSEYQLELLTGYKGVDQNDVAFIFYVLASIWAYAEYTEKKTPKYAVLVGLLAGCAILNKWLTGLLVFSGWGINMLLALRKEGGRKQALNFCLALLVCAAVFVPWLVYTLHVFPQEAAYELAYNTRHVSDVVEGHGGDAWFYAEKFHFYFGEVVFWLLPVGMIVAFAKYRETAMMTLVFYFILFFSFFSFVVKTKMYSFIMPVAPIGYMFIAVGLVWLLQHRLVHKFLYIPVVLVATFVVLSLANITTNHDLRNKSNEFFAQKSENTQVYRNLHKYMPANVQIVMNVRDYIDCMFYNPHISAHGWMLTEENMRRVKERHVPVALFWSDPDRSHIPDFIANYDSLYIINVRLK